MKMGVGFSREKEAEAAFSDAYRKSLQKASALKADFCLVFYSYDYALDQAALSGTLKKIFRDTPVYGCSTWSSWSGVDAIEAETGCMVVSFKGSHQSIKAFKVHSLREKAELWSAEIGRQIEDSGMQSGSICILADSLNFTPGSGFQWLERKFPHLQFFGMGTSFSVPQCSVVTTGDVHMNSLLALAFEGDGPWIGLLQNIKPELNDVVINRMSENLIIEIDEKPAFYKLCEHLMVHDDLPMMSPDEFRKHMGNLYVVERSKEATERPRTVGDPYRVISLLGSEMTTGMVAVAQALDFSQAHQLGQKKAVYAEQLAKDHLDRLKQKLAKPSWIWMLVNTSRTRDRDRTQSDFDLVKEVFPEAPIIGVATNGEYLGGANQFAALVVLFP